MFYEKRKALDLNKSLKIFNKDTSDKEMLLISQ